MKKEPKTKLKELFSNEMEKIEKWESFIGSEESLEIDNLRNAISEILMCYKKLVKESSKITTMGDATQRKLLKAQEEIEILNGRLSESEQNIKELNAILLEYIKATGR